MTLFAFLRKDIFEKTVKGKEGNRIKSEKKK